MTDEKGSSPKVMNMWTHPPEVLLEQYRIAVELYNHEDNLNWTKLNNLFYINAGLWAVAGLIIQFGSTDSISSPIDLRFFMGTVSVIGMIVCVALGVTLWFGVTYMYMRKTAVISIEKALKRYRGKYVVTPHSGARKKRDPLGKSPTEWVLRSVPIVFFTVWLGVFCINM